MSADSGYHPKVMFDNPMSWNDCSGDYIFDRVIGDPQMLMDLAYQVTRNATPESATQVEDMCRRLSKIMPSGSRVDLITVLSKYWSTPESLGADGVLPDAFTLKSGKIALHPVYTSPAKVDMSTLTVIADVMWMTPCDSALPNGQTTAFEEIRLHSRDATEWKVRTRFGDSVMKGSRRTDTVFHQGAVNIDRYPDGFVSAMENVSHCNFQHKPCFVAIAGDALRLSRTLSLRVFNSFTDFMGYLTHETCMYYYTFLRQLQFRLRKFSSSYTPPGITMRELGGRMPINVRATLIEGVKASTSSARYAFDQTSLTGRGYSNVQDTQVFRFFLEALLSADGNTDDVTLASPLTGTESQAILDRAFLVQSLIKFTLACEYINRNLDGYVKGDADSISACISDSQRFVARSSFSAHLSSTANRIIARMRVNRQTINPFAVTLTSGTVKLTRHTQDRLEL